MKYLIALLIIPMLSIASAQNTYELSGGVDAPLLYAGAISIGVSIPFDKKITPLSLEQIAELDPLSVNKLDRIATNTFNLSARKTSDVFIYSSPVFPLALLCEDDARNEFGTVSTMYLETVMINYGITELVKVLSKRTRPYAYNKRLNNEIKRIPDTRKSFFSGHTSHVAASTFFTAKVLSDMNPEGDLNPLYWITAASIPAVTGYLRVKGGKHFPTDVLVGYVIGALVGILVPELHKSP